MRNVTLALLLSCLASCLALSAGASDWTQWFGPNHDGTSDEKIATTWPAGGPKVVWKVDMGEGLGTPVVANGKVYILALTEPAKDAGKKTERGGVESVVCLDAATGKQAWSSPVGPSIIHEHSGNDGPRSTPAVDGGMVYALSTNLILVCFDAKSGAKVWGHDCPSEFGGTVQLATSGISNWGCANSPVIDGNLVFVHAGGKSQALLAFDKKTGKVAWKGQDDELTHCSPTVATILGQRQIIFFTKSGLVSLVPESGKVLWRYAFPWKVSTAISPVVGGDIIYCSAGYGVGGGACKITKEGDGQKATELWRNMQVISHWSTPVYHDGYLYGLVGFKQFKFEPIKCIEMATGKTMWEQKGFGQGGTMLVDGNVMILGEEGQIVLCEASPKAYKELARVEALTYKCWNQPIVSGGRIYARSTKAVVCLDVSPTSK